MSLWRPQPPDAEARNFACGTKRAGMDGHSMWSVEPIHETAIGGSNHYRLIGKRHRLVGYEWVRVRSSSCMRSPRGLPTKRKTQTAIEASVDDADGAVAEREDQTGGGNTTASSQPKFKVGDRVRIRLVHWYPCTIATYHGYLNQAIGIDREFKHVYSVTCDDGDCVERVVQNLLRAGDADACARQRRRPPKSPKKRKRQRHLKDINPPKSKRSIAAAPVVINLDQDLDQEQDPAGGRVLAEEVDEPMGELENEPVDEPPGAPPDDELEPESAGDGLLPPALRVVPASTRKEKLALELERTGCSKLSEAEAPLHYMGSCTEALEYFKRLGHNKVTTTKLRNYFKTCEGSDVWRRLGIGELDDYEFDHLLPMSSGGYEHPYNYFAMPKALNQSDAFKFYGVEKHTYIGEKVAKTLKDYVDWNATQAQSMIEQAGFEQVRTNYCPRR